MKKYVSIALGMLLLAGAAGCSPSSDGSTVDIDQLPDVIPATITIAGGGVIKVELYPKIAPQSVLNFAYLVRTGYYDGLAFHRIIQGFMIQGGCPEGTGGGNPGWQIFGEFESNGFPNELSHTRGTLSMARAPDYDSAGSQFFITDGDAFFLDGEYAAFGRVTEGMDVVDRLAETPVVDNNGTVLPGDRPIIEAITIDTDISLPEPNKLT